MLPWKIKVTTWPLNNLTTSGRAEIRCFFVFFCHNGKSFSVSNFYEESVLPDHVKLLSCQVVTFIFHGSIRAKDRNCRFAQINDAFLFLYEHFWSVELVVESAQKFALFSKDIKSFSPSEWFCRCHLGYSLPKTLCWWFLPVLVILRKLSNPSIKEHCYWIA